jgi:hypothetical protein
LRFCYAQRRVYYIVHITILLSILPAKERRRREIHRAATARWRRVPRLRRPTLRLRSGQAIRFADVRETSARFARNDVVGVGAAGEEGRTLAVLGVAVNSAGDAADVGRTRSVAIREANREGDLLRCRGHEAIRLRKAFRTRLDAGVLLGFLAASRWCRRLDGMRAIQIPLLGDGHHVTRENVNREST